MHNQSPLPQTAFHEMRTQTGLARAFFALLFVSGCFFVASTIYTALTTIRLLATMNPFPAGIFVFAGLYIVLQGLLAYGLLTAKRWVAHALALHACIVLIVATTILPFSGLGALSKTTLIGAIPIAVLAVITMSNTARLTRTGRDWHMTALYTMIVATVGTLNVMMYVYMGNAQ